LIVYFIINNPHHGNTGKKKKIKYKKTKIRSNKTCFGKYSMTGSVTPHIGISSQPNHHGLDSGAATETFEKGGGHERFFITAN
jgi:hypothetical protein